MSPDTFSMIVWTELQSIRSELRGDIKALHQQIDGIREDIERLREARRAMLLGILQAVATHYQTIVIGLAFVLGTLGFLKPDTLAWIKGLFR